jgi:mRNA interferase MazF
LKRGDIVIVSAPGDCGKPRPAVVVQSDRVSANDSVLVALCTSTLVNAPLYRLTIEPSETNGLKVASQVMVDKIVAMRRDRCSESIGRIDAAALITLNQMLAVGLAERATG